MAFIQIIEYRTSKPDEVAKIDDEWTAATQGKRSATRITTSVDHDDPGRYFQLVEFPSYEAAMDNSNLPETSSFFERYRALCDGDPKFYNLDVVRSVDT